MPAPDAPFRWPSPQKRQYEAKEPLGSLSPIAPPSPIKEVSYAPFRWPSPQRRQYEAEEPLGSLSPITPPSPIKEVSCEAEKPSPIAPPSPMTEVSYGVVKPSPRPSPVAQPMRVTSIKVQNKDAYGWKVCPDTIVTYEDMATGSIIYAEWCDCLWCQAAGRAGRIRRSPPPGGGQSLSARVWPGRSICYSPPAHEPPSRIQIDPDAHEQSLPRRTWPTGRIKIDPADCEQPSYPKRWRKLTVREAAVDM